MLRGIRGAVTIEKNCENNVREATVELINAILEKNQIKTEDIAYVQFSTTKDIDCAFSAKFARLYCGFENVPMMSTNEQDVKGALKMCIRVLVCINTDKKQDEIKHQYLGGASVLRPDIR